MNSLHTKPPNTPVCFLHPARRSCNNCHIAIGRLCRVSIESTAKQKVDIMTDYDDPRISDKFAAQDQALSLYEPSATVPDSNIREFLSYLEKERLTQPQKIELIQTYWNIAMYFVKMGHGVLPFQMFNELAKPCGETRKSGVLLSDSGPDMLCLDHQKNDTGSEKGASHEH